LFVLLCGGSTRVLSAPNRAMVFPCCHAQGRRGTSITAIQELQSDAGTTAHMTSTARREIRAPAAREQFVPPGQERPPRMQLGV